MDPVPPDEPVRLGQGDPQADLSTFAADARVDADAADRARLRWLRRQAEEETTLVGILVDLAERGRPVQVTTRADHQFSGRLHAVGTDFMVVNDERAGDVMVPLATVASVRPRGEATTAPVAPARSIVMSLADSLVELAVDRPRVAVATGRERLVGELRSAGRDTVTVTPAAGGPPVYVAVAALDHVVTAAP